VRARRRREAPPGAGHAGSVGRCLRRAWAARAGLCRLAAARWRWEAGRSRAGRGPAQLRARVPAQVRALAPADRVLVLGCSAEPHAAVKKDAAALLALFDKHILVPLPGYAARRARPRRAPCRDTTGARPAAPRVRMRAQLGASRTRARARAPRTAPAATPVAFKDTHPAGGAHAAGLSVAAADRCRARTFGHSRHARCRSCGRAWWSGTADTCRPSLTCPRWRSCRRATRQAPSSRRARRISYPSFKVRVAS